MQSEDLLLKERIHAHRIAGAMEFLQVIAEVVQSEIDLVPVAAMIVDAVKSCCWSFGSLMYRILMTLEVVGGRKPGIRSLASLLLAFEGFGVFRLVFSLRAAKMFSTDQFDAPRKKEGKKKKLHEHSKMCPF